MDTMLAFMKGEANRGKEMKVFDWDKAARIIKQNNIKNASAGLIEDWEYTAGEILEKGNPYMDSYTYLSSTWATPVLVDEDKGYQYECYIMESKTEYNSGTKWPESALKILGIDEQK